MIEHSHRVKHLREARDILESETISPHFFAALILACPESSSTIMKFSESSGMNFYYARDLLAKIAGLVLTKGYENAPEMKLDYSDEEWEWYRNVKAVGEKYVKGIKTKEQIIGAIAYGK